jgi:hypothetical protein
MSENGLRISSVRVTDALGRPLKQGRDAVQGAIRRTPVEFGHCACRFSHTLAQGRILYKLGPHFAETLSGRDLHCGAPVEELIGHVLKIFHRRAEYGRLSEPRGFQNIVPSRGYERPANKGSVGKGVQRGQFTDRIEQQDVRTFIEGCRGVDSRSTHHFPAAFGRQFGGRIETIGFARRKNQQRPAPLALDHIVRRDDCVFLSFDNAACNDHRPTLLLADLLREPGGKGAGWRRFRVIF